MKKLITCGFFALAVAMLANWGCGKEETPTDEYLDKADCTGIDASTNTYATSIKTILDDNCATSLCHDAITKEEGIDFSTYASAKSAFQNEPVLCAIHHGSGCEPMPKNQPKLDDATIRRIDCWAKNGYQQ